MPHSPTARTTALSNKSRNTSEARPAPFGAPALPASAPLQRLYKGGNARLGSNEILGLQKTIGNKNVQRLMAAGRFSSPSVVQRFTRDVTDYDAAKGRDETAALFTTKDIDPDVEGDTVRYKMNTHNPARKSENPPINVADDETMAIHATTKEPKEFYATPEVLAASNRSLANVLSPISLIAGGNTLTVNGKALQMIKPDKNKKTVQDASDEFASLFYHRCINIASMLMGKDSGTDYNHELVLKDKDSDDQSTAMINSGSNRSAGVETIANMLDKGTATDQATVGGEVDKVKGVSSDSAPLTDLGKRYGKKSGKGQLDAQEKKLGINKYARPKVGESYGTYSMSAGAGDEEKKDYASLDRMDNPATRAFTWGYHYAAVVANSTDGADSVTLENYNRTGDEKDAFTRLLDKLVLDHTLDTATLFKSDRELTVPEKLKLAFAKIKGSEGEATQAYKNALDTKAASQWYFRMQGSKDGQSFHEEQAASGYFTNPLTVRTRVAKVDVARKKAVMIFGKLALPDALKNVANFETTYSQARTASNNKLGQAKTVGAVKTELRDAISALIPLLFEGYSKQAQILAKARSLSQANQKIDGTAANRMQIIRLWAADANTKANNKKKYTITNFLFSSQITNLGNAEVALNAAANSIDLAEKSEAPLLLEASQLSVD